MLRTFFCALLIASAATGTLLALSFSCTPAVRAGPAPSVDEPVLATFYGDVLTLHGENLGGAPAERSISFDYGRQVADVSSDSSLVVLWQQDVVELRLPPGVQSGQLIVTVDGVASQPVDLLVYSYSSEPIPPPAFGLAAAVGPDSRLWLNQEFHVELRSFSSDVQPAYTSIPIPQAPGPGIFSSLLFGNSRSRASELGEDIVVGDDGLVWFTEGGQMFYPTEGPYFNTSRIVSYDPATSAFACYNAPIDNSSVIGVLIDTARGMIWYAEGGVPAAAAITGFIPSSKHADCFFDPYRGDPRDAICTQGPTDTCHWRFPLPNPISFPAHLALDNAGNIWFTEFLASKVGRLTPETGEIIELPLPAPTVQTGPGHFLGTSGPWELSFDQDGDLWVSAFFDATLLRVRPSLLQTEDCEHLDAGGQNPCVEKVLAASDGFDNRVLHTVSAGTDGLVWFGLEQDAPDLSSHSAALGFVDTNHANAVALLPETNAVASLAGIAQDPTSRDVWIVQPLDQKVGRLRQLGAGDADGDGVPDLLDNCVLVPNPGQEYANSTVLGRACDYTTCPDFNGDGLVTSLDLLTAVRYFQRARPGGGLFSIVDILAVQARLGRTCRN